MREFLRSFGITVACVILTLSGAGAALAAQDVISTVAGGGPSGMPAVNANIYQPYSVAIDASGNSYFVAAAQNKVFKISTSGVITLVAGNGNAGYGGDGGLAVNALLNYPEGVAVDGSTPANIYIADTRNCLVRKVTAATGVIITLAGFVTTPSTGAPYPTCGYGGEGAQAKSALLNQPAAVAYDKESKDLYIADYANGRVRKVAQSLSTGSITTIAGGGGSSTTANNCGGSNPYGDGATATQGYLCNPSGVSIDSSGASTNVFISDYSRCTVREVVGATKKIYTVGGIIGACGFTDSVKATSAQLNQPWQLQNTISGSTTSVYVGDYANGRIRKFTLTYSSNVPVIGNMTTFAGAGRGFCGDGDAAVSACMSPVGVAFDASGNTYLGDYDASRIRKITKSSGDINTIAGWGNTNYSNPVALGNAVASGLSLYYPIGIFVDQKSTKAYIGGAYGQAVYAFDTVSGVATTTAGNGVGGFAGDGSAANAATAQLNLPTHVARDSSGNLYIADQSNCAIRKVNASTKVISTIAGGTSAHLNGCGYAGDGGVATNARLSSPRGLAIDDGNHLFVADMNNCVIRKITLSSGTITTMAGNGTCGLQGDGGLAINASLSSPTAVAVDGTGNVYIADQNNHRIRMVDSSFGSIITVAGNGTAGYTGDGEAVGQSLYYPSGVAVDQSGNLFISDDYNDILRWVDPAGTMVTFAGTPRSAGFGGDGDVATSALLNQPQHISLDAAGNIYVADYNNSRIRKVTAFAGYGRSTDRVIFPKQHINTASTFQPIILSAVGPVTISSISVPTGFTTVDDCVGVTLATGDICEIDVTFKPTKTGITDGTLKISSNALFAKQGNSVELVGEGGGLTVAGNTTFANQLNGTKKTGTMTLTNTGASAVTIKKIYFQSTASFSVTGGSCPAAGGSLAAGANCSITVTYAPTFNGTHKGTLTVTSNDPSSPLLTAFTGTSTSLTVSPTSLAFGSVAINTTKTLNLKVTNASGSYTINPAISGTGYSILSSGNTCTSAIAAGASCTLPVQFKPTKVQSAYPGSLAVVSGASSPVVAITGAGK